MQQRNGVGEGATGRAMVLGTIWGRGEAGGLSSVAAQGDFVTVCGMLRSGRDSGERIRSKRTLADRDWREIAGTLSQLQAGRQAGNGMACSRAKARLNWVSQGQRRGRCKVRRRAERVIRPTRAKTRRLRVLVIHGPLAQTNPRRPAGQVIRHHLARQPGRRWRRSAPTACVSARRRT